MANKTQAASTTLKTAGAAATPFAPYAGLALQLGGTGLDLWQAFNNQSGADEAGELQKQMYQDQVANNRLINERNKKAQEVANTYTGANFASQLGDSVYDRYKSYYASIGK